mgnify:CR=1 FL=1
MNYHIKSWKDIKIGYKTFALDNNGELTSWAILYKRLKYKYKEWTVRENNWGPLALFELYSDAVFFAEGTKCLNNCIQKVLYIPSSDTTLWQTHEDNSVSGFDPLGVSILQKTIFADAIYVL